MESASLQSVVCAGVPGLFGYPDPTLAASFPTDRCGLPTGTVPLHLSMQGSSPREIRSPSKSLRAVICLSASLHRCSSAPSASRGVSSLFATSARGVHLPTGFPAHLCSALSVSHALDGFLLLEPCASISLRCRVQGSRSRGFLPQPGRTTSSMAVTLAPLAPPPAGCPAPANVASTSGSCSGSWSAVSGEFFTPGRHPYPLLRFQLPQASAR